MKPPTPGSSRAHHAAPKAETAAPPFAIAALVVAALALVACGDDGGGRAEDGPRSASTEAQRTTSEPDGIETGRSAAGATEDARQRFESESGEPASGPQAPGPDRGSSRSPDLEPGQGSADPPRSTVVSESAEGAGDRPDGAVPSEDPRGSTGDAAPGSGGRTDRSGRSRRAQTPSENPGRGQRPPPSGREASEGAASTAASGTYVELGEQGVGNARAPAGPAAERSPGAAPADTPAEDGSPGPPPSDSANPGDDPAPQDPARADAGEEPSDPDANRDQADADRRETPDAPGGGEEEEAGTGSARVVLQPQPPTATQGGVIQLWVSIRGGVDVRGVPFHLWYDPQRVAFQGAREGAFLAPAGNTTFMTSADDVTGRVMVGYSVLGAGQGVSGQGTLCVLTFRALAPGTASFSFSNASVRSASRGVQPASFQPAIVEIR